MKAKTIRLTRICGYCGLPITYRKVETLKRAEQTGHIHAVCKKSQREA